MEYIEGYSGHADQEWLMNFVYSFITKPKHIFLVHGEPEGQIVLKEKLEKEANLPVTIPSFGETYELKEEILLAGAIDKTPIKQKYLRLEVIDRMKTLKEELDDMEDIVREEYLGREVNDYEIIKLKEKLKELESQIVKIVENK